MKSPHKIDLKRLDKLREQMEAAAGASQRAHEAALEAHRKASVILMERRSLEHNTAQNLTIMGSRELRTKLADMEEQERRQIEEKDELFARYEPLADRAKALRSLYDRCAVFAGGENAR